MSPESTQTDFPAGDFTPEGAVRGVFGRRRRRDAHRTPCQAAAAPLAGRSDQASSPSAEPRRLRRWSVAELIARAVPAPPGERMGPGQGATT